MSFTGDVKNELYPVIDKGRDAQIAELLAIVGMACRISGERERPSVAFIADNENLCRKYFTLLDKTISIDKNAKILDGEDATKLFTVLKLFREGDVSYRIDGRLLQQESAKCAFLRGAFLCSGSVADPMKTYQYEIAVTEEISSAVPDTICFFGADARLTTRKGKKYCYVKDSTQIVELLGRMGAHKALLAFENARIYNGMRGNVNRRVNCETANIRKTVNSAVHQINCIRHIEETVGLSALPESLRQMAVVRLAHGDEPLAELGAYLDPPIGKSGVNHRLRRIVAFAEKL